MSRLSFTEALDQALELLEQGHPLEYCVRQFPEYMDELRPLLQVSDDLHRLADAALPVFDRASIEPDWESLLADIPQKQPSRLSRFSLAIAELFRSLQYHPVQRYAALTAAVIILVVVSWSGSAQSHPHSPLYQIKQLTEKVELGVALSPESEVERRIEFTRRRLEELQTLTYQTREIDPELLRDALAEAQDAVKAAQQGGVGEEFYDQLALLLADTRASISQLKAELPAPQVAVLNNADLEVAELREDLNQILIAETGVTPTAVPTSTAPTPTPTAPAPTKTPAPTNLPATAPNQDDQPVAPPTASLPPTATDSNDVPTRSTPTGVPTRSTPTPVPTTAVPPQPTSRPTSAPTVVPTEEPTAVPTAEPTSPPTVLPTEEPTQAPTSAPTEAPTSAPTEEPTQAPTSAPTEEPTQAPTQTPTEMPTAQPTVIPTEEPTVAPTDQSSPTPTSSPVVGPTEEPTTPTSAPTEEPTTPTGAPTEEPTETVVPLPTETVTPTDVVPSPTPTPTAETPIPTAQVTITIVPPTSTATSAPTDVPTETPTIGPTDTTGPLPTETPTATEEPTQTQPTATAEPTTTEQPTATATEQPTETPTDVPPVATNSASSGVAIVQTEVQQLAVETRRETDQAGTQRALTSSLQHRASAGKGQSSRRIDVVKVAPQRTKPRAVSQPSTSVVLQQPKILDSTLATTSAAALASPPVEQSIVQWKIVRSP